MCEPIDTAADRARRRESGRRGLAPYRSMFRCMPSNEHIRGIRRWSESVYGPWMSLYEKQRRAYMYRG